MISVPTGRASNPLSVMSQAGPAAPVLSGQRSAARSAALGRRAQGEVFGRRPLNDMGSGALPQEGDLSMRTSDATARLGAPHSKAPNADALGRVLDRLKAEGYRFITPTPATHRRRVRAMGGALGASVRDALGWSLPFPGEALSPPLFEALDAAGVLLAEGTGYRLTIRVSSLGEDLFIHSAFPPAEEDAVFFGPDTYRFARFLRHRAPSPGGVRRLIDLGTGSGVGAVVAARATGAAEVIAGDINPTALAWARINLAAAGVPAACRLSRGLEAIPETADLIIANPPYMAGSHGRTYRDGGDMHGARLSLDWALAGSAQLAPAGRFLLYTGSAIIDGRDPLQEALSAGLDPATCQLDYEELDPDIFGGQLGMKGYEGVERIAAIGAVITRRG